MFAHHVLASGRIPPGDGSIPKRSGAGRPERDGMSYLRYALLALVGYTLVPPLTKLASDSIPSDVVAFVSNAILAVAALGVVLTSDEKVVPYLTADGAVYMYGAGLCLAVGIIAYYRSLALGPVSVVTPIFGMFLVTSSLVGVAFLNETLSAQKVIGVLFAVLALVLVTTDDQMLRSALSTVRGLLPF